MVLQKMIILDPFLMLKIRLNYKSVRDMGVKIEVMYVFLIVNS